MPTQDEPRRVAGRYRLDGVLGRGAMGTVWAAHDETLGRAVAVKEVLLPPGIPDGEADALRERTLREARAIAVLSHPNVVTLYDVAREGGDPFVVMELVPSRSLAEVLREDGPLAADRAATVGLAVASALAAAHAAGITHRDVKPGNVLVAHDGRVKLTDFGIARNRADATITASGLMLGSPAFMAPEVALGRGVTPAADLWGLGATLFAATEGRSAYGQVGDPVETVSAVVHGDVPAPTGTGPVAEVIRGLMVKDPALRLPLHEVDRLLRPLADNQDRTPFALAPSAPRNPAPPPPRAAAAPSAPGPAVPLAADPGPLPWTTGGDGPAHPAPAAPAPRPPSRARSALLYALAALLVVAGAGTAFTATRTVAGLPVLPVAAPSAQTAAPNTPADAPVPLLPQQVTLDTPEGSDPAPFEIAVPAGWTAFRENRTVAGVEVQAIRFVSPDGAAVVAVDRVGGFASEEELPEYLEAYLRGIEESVTRLVEVGRDTGGSQVEVTYRTVEGTGDDPLLRTTFLRMVPVGSDLWVVRATVPSRQEEAGRSELFDRVLPTFTPLT